jgi:superfamily II DNA/RNA helicase
MPEDDGSIPAHKAEPVSFRDLNVIDDICAALEDQGITTAFPIQALALPIGLDGHDIIGQARTGTGKTLAFGIPLLQRLAAGQTAPQALVVVPTRELAIQVAEDLRVASARIGTRVLTVYGGRAYEPQIDALRKGVEVVVGTPGRLLDLAGQHYLDLSNVTTLVLDEADRMLDLGFLPDVERILNLVPRRQQSMMFSATMPSEVVTLARRHLDRPMHVRAEGSDEPETSVATEQHVFRIHHMDKIEVLVRVLQAKDRGLTMVFTQTKRAADMVNSELTRRGFAVASVHGDLGQGQRERALRAFRNGKVDVLVATDVAARGLDVDDVTHVINYECPEDDKAYLHRIGRTGRAGRTGIAVTFVDWRDMRKWKLIDESLDLGFAEPEETYSTSEVLFAALNIPPTVTGTLPKADRARAGLDAETIEDIGETGRTRTPRSRSGERSGRSDERSGRSGRDEKRTRTRGGARDAAHSTNGDGTSADAHDQDGAGARTRTRTRSRRRTRRGQDIAHATEAHTTEARAAEVVEAPVVAAPIVQAPVVAAPIVQAPAAVAAVAFIAPTEAPAPVAFIAPTETLTEAPVKAKTRTRARTAAKTKSTVEADAGTQTKADAETKAAPKTKADAETESAPKTEPAPKTKAAPKAKAAPKTKAAAKAKAAPKANAAAETEAGAKPKSATRTRTTAKAKAAAAEASTASSNS